jgi:hypothetical protein
VASGKLRPFVALIALAALPFTTVAAEAQKLGRKIEGELSGNVFFGNTRQILASLRAEHERVDSSQAVRLQTRYNYGQTTTDEDVTVVSKRSWLAGISYDWRPFGDFAPYLRAELESSFEQRIDRRVNAGTGARMNVIRDSLTDLILSVGVSGERTMSLPPGDTAGVVTLARGSTRLRLRRVFNSRVSLTSENAYSPALTESGDYTILSLTTLKVKLASFASLTLSLRDGYDSRAVRRGARSNNEGQVLAGLLTTF